jgi:nocturnin
VDHFKFLRKWLASLGYIGHFLPKPDSPCLYLDDNSGPDGCAIFYKQGSILQNSISTESFFRKF